jgi:hypothetical protein
MVVAARSTTDGWQIGKTFVVLIAFLYTQTYLMCEPVPEDSAFAVEALLMDWSNLSGYAFPKIGLLRK